jgi:hypothetical protein
VERDRQKFTKDFDSKVKAQAQILASEALVKLWSTSLKKIY